MNDAPIEDLLDDLLRRTRADARTTRRLLEEASDHLHATSTELQNNGISREQAEIEAVRRFGSVTPIVQTTFRQSFLALTVETLRAAVFLAGCGLIAVGISGLVALVMNLWAGQSFGGGETAFASPSPSIQETADDAVVLRVIAGLVGPLIVLGYLLLRRRPSTPPLLPDGLVDALGSAAFAAATAGLTIASADQAAQTGTAGVGFPLTGALVALPATVYFAIRAARALIAPRTQQLLQP